MPIDCTKGLLAITDLKLRVDEGDRLIASSYFTLFLTKRSNVAIHFKEMEKESEQKEESREEMIKLSEHKKLIQDYQILKAINLTLM